MQGLTKTRFRLIAAYLMFGLLVAGFASVFYQNTLNGELNALREQGKVRLSEASSRFRLQIDG